MARLVATALAEAGIVGWAHGVGDRERLPHPTRDTPDSPARASRRVTHLSTEDDCLRAPAGAARVSIVGVSRRTEALESERENGQYQDESDHESTVTYHLISATTLVTIW